MTGPDRPGGAAGWRLTRRGLLGLGALGGLAGCGLEADQTIRPGLDIDAEPRVVRYLPPGPQAGDGPMETIRGFMRAGKATGPELRVPREFLTDEAADAWLPDSQTVVYSGTPAISELGDGRYRVTLRVSARIDSDARYTVGAPYDSATFDFGLTRIEGSWRIGELQQGFGRVVPSYEVSRMYRAYPVHYPAVVWNRLVADLRWIPVDQQATRLTRAQLGGVPEYLTGAVRSDDGAELIVDSVPVTDGVAGVDLKPESLSADATDRRQLVAQLVATLMQLPDVSEVNVTVGGASIELSGVQAPLTTAEQLDYVDPRPSERPVMVRVGDHLVGVDDDRLTSLDRKRLAGRDSDFAEVPTRWRHLALSTDAAEVAAVSAQGTELSRWRDDGSIVPVPSFAGDLVRPGYDVHGVLWLAGHGLGTEEGNHIWSVNSAADVTDEQASAPQALPSGWLEDRLVQAAAVSPEGSRLALVSAPDGGASVLEVVGVERSANRLPTGLSQRPLRVAALLVEIRDVVWVGETTLAVIGRDHTQRTVMPYLVDVGGELREMTPRGGAVEVTTIGGERDIVLGNARGTCWIRTGSSWRELTAIDDVVVGGS